MATRYRSYDSRSSTSSHFSDPSSSIHLNSSASSRRPNSSSSSSRAVVKSKPLDAAAQGSCGKIQAADLHLTGLMKKFMDKKSANKTTGQLVIPSDVIAEDLKKTARKGAAFTALQRKLFGKGSSNKENKKEVKALTEVKGNTRTLAMVLRSERELLSANKELEMEVSELKLLLQDKNREVEKLKDLCLKQREEIKSLKSAILFPDAMNSQLQHLVEKQGSELTQAKQLIPTLQRQVTSLTGQLQCLAEDLAQVKAEKYSSKACRQQHGSYTWSPRYDGDEPSDSLEFSSCEPTTLGSPDDLSLEDLNPCLTPYYAKTKSKEFDEIRYDSPDNKTLSDEKRQAFNELVFGCSK
ncbi:oligopeptide transporter 5-like [Hibiscus syriacus]|uniref:Oligopeptide transporter 5-like n=1 Tax=Hibiscus syriacus TaxID=106335 RepID=A0A6A3C509_HIBSY|nr:outer dense fiber protein 2-like [Hibiscus syriacus]KAE8723101.1 oligopeptide transporter 5-like [Hibiscus syriacus]